MTRAQGLFEARGLNVIPYPVDFKAQSNHWSVIDICPSAKAFEKTEMVFREILGQAFYAVRDWGRNF
jgi:uncharacterized SAM-binding protein YcdF (DUF218 family)